MAQQNNEPMKLSRRRLLQGMAALSAVGICSSLFPAQMAKAAQPEVKDFVAVSSFLVNRPVSSLLAQRYHEALVKHYKNFPAELAQLSGFITANKFTDIDDFTAKVSKDQAEFKLAQRIIAAWYTGIVGELPDVELIAYAEAMMYLPTKGILVVPTYGAGLNTWGPKPGNTKEGAAA